MSEKNAPVGVTGLPVYGNRIWDEWDKRLQGDRATKTYRQMAEGSPTVSSFLFAFKALVMAAGRRIEPADESEEAAEAARFVDGAIDDMDGAWSDTMSEMLSDLVFGFVLFEQSYKRRLGLVYGPDGNVDELKSSRFDDGRIGWERWSPRPQETIIEWLFDPTGTIVTHAVQQAPPNHRRIEIPLQPSATGPGCLHIRVLPRKQNPMGTSLLRSVFQPYYYSEHIQRMEAIGYERNVGGIPVGRIPVDVYNDATLRQPWMDILQNLRRDEAAFLLLPSEVDPVSHAPLYSIELLSPGGDAAFSDASPILARYERQMLHALLAKFLTLGDNGVGSFAQSVNVTDLFMQSVKALLDGKQDAINVQAVKRLCRIPGNGVRPAMIPTFQFGKVERSDIQGFAEAFSVLVQTGMVDIEDEQLRQYVYDLFGLPLPKTTTSLPPKTEPKKPPADKAATEERIRIVATDDPFESPKIDDAAMDRARKAWDAVVPERYRGMLDAEVVE